MGLLGWRGIALTDEGWAGAARRSADDEFHPSHDLFQRRLIEARAFGAASEQLSLHFPEFSARRGLTAAQRLSGWGLLLACLGWASFDAWAALNTLLIAIGLTFGLVIALRFATVAAAWPGKPQQASPRLPDGELIDITILVPLYREANVVPDLIAALAKLDYPSWRLDVKLLVEADDPETIDAIVAMNLPIHFEVLPVPPGEPRTKPKALNYGLAFARGALVAVFDAEDRPAPDQPRAAVAAFRNGPANLAVVQAPLHIHNGGESWIARQFSLEYAIHFRVWLPLFAKLGLPMALGGTSNYFHRDRLVQAGGWDAWNVTEDADVGIRLARLGGAARMITPPTEEEAPATWKLWRNQRTRWIKGHLQTWLVLNRNPWRVFRELGPLKFLSTQLALGGGLLASLLHAPLYLWIIAAALAFRHVEPWHVALAIAGYLSVIASALASRSGEAQLRTLLTVPFYWPLQSVAMLGALFEMKARPHFWAKTPHGIATQKIAANVESEIVTNNVIQLEFPFAPPSDAAKRQLVLHP